MRNGWYGIWPDGSGYEAIEIREGKLVDTISQSEAGSHRNGQNHHYIWLHDAMDNLYDNDPSELPEHEAIVELWSPGAYCVGVDYLG